MSYVKCCVIKCKYDELWNFWWICYIYFFFEDGVCVEWYVYGLDYVEVEIDDRYGFVWDCGWVIVWDMEFFLYYGVFIWGLYIFV